MVAAMMGSSETGRVEAFSDGVFAITWTLLVLDLRTLAAGRFGLELVAEWPAYTAFSVRSCPSERSG